MTKKKKVFLSISSLLLMLILYGWFFGFQTFLVLMNRWYMPEQACNMVPQPVMVTIGSDPVMFIEAFDYSFSIPWSGFSEYYSSTSTTAWTTSHSNISVICFAPEQQGLGSLMLSQARMEDDSRGYQWFADALELDGVAGTNHFLCSKMWNVTPRDVSIFDSRSEALIESILLMLKSISVPALSDSVYSYEVDNAKGFQVGDSSKDSSVHLTLFDLSDRQIELVIGIYSNFQGSITQQDINTIITTFSVEP